RGHQPAVALAQLGGAARIAARVDLHRERDARIVHRHVRAAPPAVVAPQVERAVDGDAVDPGVELAGGAELAQLAERAQESFLGDVVGVVRVAGEVQRQRVDARAIAARELAERGLVAALRAGDQLGGGERARGCVGHGTWTPEAQASLDHTRKPGARSGVDVRRSARYGLGMRMVLEIISAPSATKASTSGCSACAPRCSAPNGSDAPTRPARASSASTPTSSRLVVIGAPSK